jgi:uncharacterized protein (DUF1015 family)
MCRLLPPVYFCYFVALNAYKSNMAKIIPFKGLRPVKDLAAQVATLPYDVCSVAEARKYKDDPYHFYHVTRSEIDLPENVDVHSQDINSG